MDWNVCRAEHISNVTPDKGKIASMRKMCSVRLRMLKMTVLDEETASVIVADYYEVIKELLVALLLKNGLKSDNHECLISYFKVTFSEYAYETEIIHTLKDIRNRVSYDGIFVKKEYVQDNKLEFEHIILLLDRLLEDA